MSKEECKFFGEWVHYEEGNAEDKEEAKRYLALWEKFLIRKLKADLPDYEPMLDDFHKQFIERPAQLINPIGKYGTLGVKITYKKKLPYELG